jgi:hypothetical protein
LAACGAAAPKSEEFVVFPEEAMAPYAEPEAARDMATMGEADGVGGGGGLAANDVASAERLVIKNANLSIVVDNPELRLDQISDLADRLGGFVVNSSVYKNNYGGGLELPSAYITIRVPADTFQQALDEIREGAIDIPNDNQTGQDVTAEYTDLQSRLRNLEDAEEMLRQIMEEAVDTEDVLNAFNQLNYITEQIEVLRGQIQYYEDSAALSSISVEIIPNESVQPIEIGPWDIGGTAKEAIQALVKALQGIADALVWFLLYVVPVVLIIGLPLLLIGWGVRKWAVARSAGGRRKK